MKDSKQSIATSLRKSARNGMKPSCMLRELFAQLGPKAHKLDVLRHMREAFYLTLQEAAPIAGWSPDGHEGLQDAQLDAFILPEINKKRAAWDNETSSL